MERIFDTLKSRLWQKTKNKGVLMTNIAHHEILVENLRKGEILDAKLRLGKVADAGLAIEFLAEMREKRSLDCYQKIREPLVKNRDFSIRIGTLVNREISRLKNNGRYVSLGFLKSEIEKCDFLPNKKDNLLRIQFALDSRFMAAKPEQKITWSSNMKTLTAQRITFRIQ